MIATNSYDPRFFYYPDTTGERMADTRAQSQSSVDTSTSGQSLVSHLSVLISC
jgi:hypothetical protein